MESQVPQSRNFVLFKTDLFVFHQRDEDIDKWFVGGDCAGWFYARLLLENQIRNDCDPVMEDWGWTFAVSVNGVRAWLNVWAFFGIENCWLFGIESRNALLRWHSTETLFAAREIVANALEAIMNTDSRILKRRWFQENPFDLDVKDF